jgi:phospholipid transport system transporter-binding protein
MNSTASEGLGGDLTVREVPAVWRHLFANLPDEIDLAGIERTDSSALALLLECRALASERGKHIEFRNPPNTLRVIARLTEVDELLGWSPPDQEMEDSP